MRKAGSGSEGERILSTGFENQMGSFHKNAVLKGENP